MLDLQMPRRFDHTSHLRHDPALPTLSIRSRPPILSPPSTTTPTLPPYTVLLALVVEILVYREVVPARNVSSKAAQTLQLR